MRRLADHFQLSLGSFAMRKLSNSLLIHPSDARRWLGILMVTVIIFSWVTRVAAQSVSNGLWQAQSIYQIITDRFFDGDPSNDNADGNYNAGGARSVHGGDFRGIEQKLDYIKALGATAIWISPVVLNGSGQFHGYAGRDFTRWIRIGEALRTCNISSRQRTHGDCWSLTTSFAITVPI